MWAGQLLDMVTDTHCCRRMRSSRMLQEKKWMLWSNRSTSNQKQKVTQVQQQMIKLGPSGPGYIELSKLCRKGWWNEIPRCDDKCCIV